LIRRERRLDYAQFNRALAALGRTGLSSLAELQRQFEVWKSELSPACSTRIRRSIQRAGTPPAHTRQMATTYRTLEFIDFDSRMGQATGARTGGRERLRRAGA
jgi:hypothetical protein